MTSAELKNRLGLLKKQAAYLESRMDHLIKTTEMGVLVVQHNLILEGNRKACELLGVKSIKPGAFWLENFLQPSLTTAKKEQSVLADILKKAAEGREQQFTTLILSKGKDPFIATLFISALNRKEELLQVLIREHKAVENDTFPDGKDKNNVVKKPVKNLKPEYPFAEANYREIFNAVNEGILVQDIGNGRVVDVNIALLSMFNGTHEDILDKIPDGLSRGTAPYDKEHALHYFMRAVREGECIFEWHSRKLSGELFWTEIHHKRVLLHGEEFILSVIRDISQRKTMEEKLGISENRFKNFVDLSTDVILYIRIDPPMDTSLSSEDQLNYLLNHTFLGDMNDAFLKLKGIKNAGDFIGKPLSSIITPAFKSIRPAQFGLRFILSGYRLINMETAYEEKDENYKYFQNTVIGIPYDNKLVGFWVSMRNISELKIAERSLRYKTGLDKLVSSISTRFINLPPENIDRNIESALGEISNITRSDAGFLFLFSGSYETFSLTHFWSNKKIQVNRPDYINLPLIEIKWIVDELEKNGKLSLPSKGCLLTESSKKWVDDAKGVESIFIMPVYYQENLAGMTGLISSVTGNSWKEEDVPILKVVGEIFINALQRKNAEKALMLSEQNYREIFNATIEAIIILEPVTGQIIDVNLAFLELFSYTYEEAMRCSLEMLSVDATDVNTERIGKMIRRNPGKGSALVEWRAKRKNNEEFWTELSVKNTEIGGEKRILAVIREISDRKEAQEALVKSEERFRSILQFLTDIIWIVDKDMVISYESPSSPRVMGYKPGFLKGKKATDYMHPDDLPVVLRGFEAVIKKTNRYIPAEFRARHAEGHYIRLEAIANNLLDHKSINGIVVTCRDITERKKAEMQLKESEEKFRVIYETALDGIFMMLEDRFVDCNPAIPKMFGCSREEILGKQPYLFSPEFQPDGRLSKEKAMDKINSAYDGQPQFFEWLHCRHDGSLFETEVALIRIELGGVAYLQAIVRDITRRKVAEKALRDSEAKFRNIFNSSTDGILILGQDYRFRVANNTFLEKTGLTLEQVIQMSPADVLPETIITFINDKIRDVFRGIDVPSHEVEVVRPSLPTIFVEIYSKLIDYEGEKALLSIIRDITERKQFDKKIIDTIIMTEEKERENFAKNLHDEIGPLLSSIKMYINSLESSRVREKQEFIIWQLKEITKEAIQSTKEISNDLSPHILSNYGLNAAIDSFINRISHIYTIHYETNIGNSRFHELVETSVYRIIKELVNNTLKHSQGTTIHISIKYIRGVLDLQYSDNGRGLPNEQLERKDPAGMGISNIVSRARSLNAVYKFFNVPAGGMGFECKVHVEKNT